jgi:hypothetical protein
MGASSFRYLCLVPARVILRDPTVIPDTEGVYYAFLEGGMDLLSATSYFEYASRDPLTHDGAAHLYTGASINMRARLLCHLIGGEEQSGFRKTLMAVEFARKAISETKTPGSHVTNNRSLSGWLSSNAQFAFVPCSDAKTQERQLLRGIPSPLNIRNQRSPEFARQLLGWRAKYHSYLARHRSGLSLNSADIRSDAL